MPVDPLLALFAEYNPAIWPLQPLAYLGAIALLMLMVVRPSRRSDQLLTGFVAAIWLFIGIVFQGLFVREMDSTLSTIYAVAFVAQAVLLVAYGVVGDRVVYSPTRSLSSALGWASIGYALIVYPLIGAALGHAYPQAPLFGAAPCPTTIFTFGLLLLARPPLPKRLLVIPLAWALAATPAAVGRGVLEDVVMLVVAVLGVVLVIARDRRAASADTPAPSGLRRGTKPDTAGAAS